MSDPLTSALLAIAAVAALLALLALRRRRTLDDGALAAGMLAAFVTGAVGGWIWQNRERPNESAQSAASHLADIDAECGNKP